MWGGEPGISGGKLDQFPLESEGDRVFQPRGRLPAEKRLLIDPCIDQPERHLRFDLRGQIGARKKSKKGATSIDVFKLQEPRLREIRRVRICEVVAILRALARVDRQEQANVAEARKTIKIITTASSQFAGAARYVVHNPEEFGVSESEIDWAR